MRKLLAHHYVSAYEHENTEYIILCLLHELRIMTAKQLYKLLKFEYEIALVTVQKSLIRLRRNELVDKFVLDVDKKTFVYHLTKQGHNNIGGYYSFPKVPEYNLNHHLKVTDSLIDTFSLLGNHKNLSVVQSERRLAYERKDFNKDMKGKVFSVADYLFRFQSERGREVNWHFEIELSAKTRRRYRDGIFPKYIRELEQNFDAHLFYVTPVPFIQSELERYKKYFFGKSNERKPEVFERLHIIPARNFKTELQKIITTDPYINW